MIKLRHSNHLGVILIATWVYPRLPLKNFISGWHLSQQPIMKQVMVFQILSVTLMPPLKVLGRGNERHDLWRSLVIIRTNFSHQLFRITCCFLCLAIATFLDSYC